MIARVIPPLSYRKPFRPVMRLCSNKAPQLPLKCLVNHLSLTIWLRVVSWGEFQLHSLNLKEFLPELASKSKVPVTRYFSSMPYNLRTLLINISAILASVQGWVMTIKWANLVTLSTTTKIAEYLDDWGNPLMKSIEIEVQTLTGIGWGCKSPDDLVFSSLILWQVSRCQTCSLMSIFMPTQ